MSKLQRSAGLVVTLLLTRRGALERHKQDREKALRGLALESTAELIRPVAKRDVRSLGHV